MASVVVAATALLLALLVAGAALDRLRQRVLERQFDQVLSGGAQEALDYLAKIVESHALGVEVARRAVDAENVERLRKNVWVVETFAPRMWEGLRALWALSRTVEAIVALPPVRVTIWQAWVLRGYAGAAAALHHLLVTGAERTRLRIWLLSRALRFGLRRLRLLADEDAPQWIELRSTLSDLDVVGKETTATAERVIRSLDAAGALPGHEKAKTTRTA